MPRSTLGIRLSFKRDTPNRDISADITDLSATASDTGASVTQDKNQDRQRIVLNPVYTYNLTRRTDFSFDYSFTSVSHAFPDCDDALRAQGITGDEPFTPTGELEDFQEHALKLTSRHQLSVLDLVYATVGYSRFSSEKARTEGVDFSELEPDQDCLLSTGSPQIFRSPTADSTVDTTRFTLGYERALSPTLTAGGQLGYYIADSDFLGETSETTGYLANATVNKTTGLTRYTGRVGIEVYPSDIGDVVESLELVGDMHRELGPLLDFSFRIRAYEPDAISDDVKSEFSRRFLSIEPKLIWRFSRAWTAAASYRYRRQKSQTNPETGESNALLFSIKYNPPSAIADARNAQ